MANITLINNASIVTLDFNFNTPQQFFYTVEVVDDMLKQYFHDSGQWGGKISFNLGIASNLIGKYLNIYWVIIDPVGAGNPYDGTGTISQAGVAVPLIQECSGTSSNITSLVTTSGKFTI